VCGALVVGPHRVETFGGRIRGHNPESQNGEAAVSDEPADWEENLDGIGRSVLQHMKKHQPNLYRHLRQKGGLRQYLLSVQEQAGQYLEKADAAGRPFEETQEVIRETWISLPDVDAGED
jgi:hypothetical protein